MYEKPILVECGKVTDVVLGIMFLGDDLDGSYIIADFEFLPDPPESDCSH